jgi:hypothetical protein
MKDPIMKKNIRLPWTLGWLSLNAAAAVFISGCATPPEHSFNEDYGQSLPTQPKYYIEDVDATHFKVVVHQGTYSTGAERRINVKEAASVIARAESKRRGWENWELNYIREGDQGWMHIVIGEVKRIPYLKPAVPPAP